MSLKSYVLTPSGPCPPILLVTYGSLVTPIEQTRLTASATLAANKSYQVVSQNSTPIDLTVPPCTVSGDQIVIEFTSGTAPLKIKTATATIWTMPAPTPGGILTLMCDGNNWSEVK